MPSAVIKLTGSPDYIRCIHICLVRAPEVVAQISLQEDSSFSLALTRNVALAASNQGLQVVLGAAGMGKHLAHLPSMQRLPVKRASLDKGDAEVRVSTEGVKLSEVILKVAADQMLV